MSRFRLEFSWLTCILILSNAIVLLIVLFTGQISFSFSVPRLLAWGALFNPLTLDREPWRILTAMFLHGNILHLAVNMHSLWVLGTNLDRRIGKMNFVLLYFLSGLGASIATLYFSHFVVSVGASGAIFGLYGFYIVSAFIKNIRNYNVLMTIVPSFVIFLFLNILFSKSLHLDWVAHIGGFITGGLIFCLDHYYARLQSFRRKYLTTILTSLIILYLGILFFILPKWQVDYFKAFQALIQTEKYMENQVYQNQSDDELAKALEAENRVWEVPLKKFRDLPESLPAKVSEDRRILSDYISYQMKENEFKIIGIQRESYIYMDSTAEMNRKIQDLKPIHYHLLIKEIDENEERPSNAQKSDIEHVRVYYDSLWKETVEEKASYYRTGFKDSLKLWSGPVADFYIDGKIQMKGKYKMGLKDGIFIYYSDHNTYEAAGVYKGDWKVGKWEYFHKNGKIESEVRHDPYFLLNAWDAQGNPMVKMGEGVVKDFHPNGNLKLSYTVKNGQRDGNTVGYFESGDIEYVEVFSNGRFIQGKSRNENGDRFTYDLESQFPSPNGGWEKFYKYLQSNIKYPEEGIKQNIFGKVEVTFTVDHLGEISDLVFRKRLGLGYEEEAERLIREGPKWSPARRLGYVPVSNSALVVFDFARKE